MTQELEVTTERWTEYDTEGPEASRKHHPKKDLPPPDPLPNDPTSDPPPPPVDPDPPVDPPTEG